MEVFGLPDSINILVDMALGTPRSVSLRPVGHKREFASSLTSPAKRRKVSIPVVSTQSLSVIGSASAIVPFSKSNASGSYETASNSITLDMLRPHFEEPLTKVATCFGICVTLLKKICRRLGIARWPHRQITGLRKSIASMEHAIGYFDGARRESYAGQLLKQKKKLAALLENPTTHNLLLANEDESRLAKVKPTYIALSGSEMAPAIKKGSVSSPRGPLLVESPIDSVPYGPEPIQSSGMWTPRPHYGDQKFSSRSDQPVFTPYFQPSTIENFTPKRDYTLEPNSVSSYVSSASIRLPPLRALLPPISSLIAINTTNNGVARCGNRF
ncbi:hypothetical protein CCR75_001086 [Bremia lactucae]|uniref:RWP-RK domain-containing protein n=1 Tax=Bremia lactucae TaxID=4779 RepID=A0A976FRM4_BRELC|nr:hypothetical protein CCR75_001086 [Bremia lactucae]